MLFKRYYSSPFRAPESKVAYRIWGSAFTSRRKSRAPTVES